MDDEKSFLDFYRKALKTDNLEFLSALASRSTSRQAAKGTRLYQEGEEIKDCYFLCSGIIRVFYQAADGTEITEWLLSHYGALIFPNYTLKNGPYADSSAETLTDCELLHIPLAELLEVSRRYPEMERIRFRMLLTALENQRELRRNLSHRSPAERYAWLMENRAEMMEKVPQKYIASFLGITPVSLSRIRSRYKQQSNEE